MPELPNEDILKLQEKVLPCRFFNGTHGSGSVYMHCLLTKLNQIRIEANVCAFIFGDSGFSLCRLMHLQNPVQMDRFPQETDPTFLCTCYFCVDGLFLGLCDCI
jgi:hypothetical protein